MADNCPECGTEVQAGAKLCIDCGFHFERGEKISRGRLHKTPPIESDERSDIVTTHGAGNEQVGTNPYAPPETGQEETRLAWEITEADLPKLRRVAGGAIPIFISVCMLPCICFPLSTLMLPLSTYRLLQWWQLYQQFENLRTPNSLSPEVELELQFQKAFWQYVVSILLGIAWLVFFVVAQLQWV